MTRSSSRSSTRCKQHGDEEHPVHMHRVLGDGAYDRNELSNILEERGSSQGSRPGTDAATQLDRVILSG
jgi:hypothetical protein